MDNRRGFLGKLGSSVLLGAAVIKSPGKEKIIEAAAVLPADGVRPWWRPNPDEKDVDAFTAGYVAGKNQFVGRNSRIDTRPAEAARIAALYGIK